LDDYLWGAYFGIFLEYFEQKSFKKSWKYSSHYYVMVYIKIYYKYIIFKKNQVHLPILLLLKNINYSVFGYFSFIRFIWKKLKNIYQSIENNLM
jgi:hypothetical protein